LPLPVRPRRATWLFAVLLLHLFRCIDRAQSAAPFSSCRTRTKHAFQGGDDEITITHFAPPLAADGLSRFTADTHLLTI
jgi:hypothetical protein